MDQLAVFIPMLVAGVVFVELFKRLDTATNVRELMRMAPQSLQVMRSAELSDADKEQQIRALSLSVLLCTLRFTWKFMLVVVVCAAVFLGLGWLMQQTPDALLMKLWSWSALASVALVAAYAKLRDQLLHRHAS